MWKETAASWVGSGPTKVLTGMTYNIRDIDWIVQRTFSARFEQQLLTEGYEKVVPDPSIPRSQRNEDGEEDGYMVGDATLQRYINITKGKHVDLVLVGPDTTADDVIYHYHSTAVMNRIDVDKCVMYYTPLTTTNRIQFRYDPAFGVPESVRVALRKYCIGRHFSFDGLLPPMIDPHMNIVSFYGW